MSQETDPAVGRALDAMERMHRRIVLLGWGTVVATLASYVWLDHLARTGADTRRLILAAVTALTCLIAWTTFALAVLLVRMSRRILRAIDLTSGRS